MQNFSNKKTKRTNIFQRINFSDSLEYSSTVIKSDYSLGNNLKLKINFSNFFLKGIMQYFVNKKIFFKI